MIYQCHYYQYTKSDPNHLKSSQGKVFLAKSSPVSLIYVRAWRVEKILGARETGTSDLR